MTPDRLPLRHLRVVDMADEKGELCGRLLADLGADVLRVEAPKGAASRGIGPFHAGESLYFAVRNANKRTLALDPATDEGRRRVLHLLDGADLWIESASPGALAALGLDPDDVVARMPHLVAVSITDFGQTGPYRDFVATDPVMVGLSWSLFRAGVPELPPVLPPGHMAYDIAGITAAFAALTGLAHRARTGRGQRIDLSVMEAVAQTTDWGLSAWSAMQRVNPSAYAQIRSGGGPIYPIIPCKDGWIRPSIVSTAEWRKMREWMGEPPELQSAELDMTPPRVAIYASTIRPRLVELFAGMTMIEASEEGQRRRIPITPLLRPADVLAADHYRELGTFANVEAAPGVTGPVASGFYLLDGERAGSRTGPTPAPTAGEPWRSPERFGRAAATDGALPYAGLVVLDFGVAGAAPEIGRLFAEYGADVIRVESPKRPDLFRQLGGPSGMSPVFASSSRTKRSLGVDFESPAAIGVVKDLVRRADVVVENLPPGTMARYGLGRDALLEINPRLVMVGSQTMGSHGPWRDWRGYGANTQPPGGMTYLWSFPDLPEPVGSNVAFPDHVVGRLGAVAAAACLAAGQARHIEIVQAEVSINLLADLYLQEGLRPGSVQPAGNDSERGTPWGVFPCAGEQRWCVITCRDDADWQGLVDAMGHPDWATPDLATVAGRRARQGELDARVAAWTSARADRDVMATLQAHGVPAGYMLYVGDTSSDPHFVARGYPIEIDQPGVGPVLVEGAAFRSVELPTPITTPAPLLGEHTRDVTTGMLGMTAADVDALIAGGALFDPPQL
jgi:crotonobetainyl-CoA:carnitine CoA-transferase CaiB-like acyl-CoA transferase